MHSILKQQDRILPRFQRLSGEPALQFGNTAQIHGTNDDIQPTVSIQVTRCHHIPLIAGAYGKRVWLEVVGRIETGG
jgi:hypothetical protein